MSSDQYGLAVKLVRRDAESCVLTLTGELSLRSAGTVCGAITKALLTGTAWSMRSSANARRRRP